LKRSILIDENLTYWGIKALWDHWTSPIFTMLK